MTRKLFMPPLTARAALVLACCLAWVGLAACTTRYHSIDVGPQHAMKLERQQGMYVCKPADGGFEDRMYDGSGTAVTSYLYAYLAPYGGEVYIGSEPESLEQALASAKSLGVRYLVVPAIEHWEHRKAAWSGKASKVSLNISVYDLQASGPVQPVIMKELDAKGRNMTLKSQYPSDIMRPMLERFATDIF